MNVRSKLTLTEKLLYYFLAFIAVIFRLKMEVVYDEDEWIDEVEAKVTKC
jgi:cell division protein FtsL